MTPDTIKSKLKDYIAIIIGVLAILAAIGNYGAMKANNAVLEYKVESNKKILDEYNIPVLNEKVITMSKDVTDIKIMFTDFIKVYNANK